MTTWRVQSRHCPLWVIVAAPQLPHRLTTGDWVSSYSAMLKEWNGGCGKKQEQVLITQSRTTLFACFS